MIHFSLPDVDDLVRLGDPHPYAVSVYLPTAPTPAGRQQAMTAAKSAVDAAIRSFREAGASHAIQEQLRDGWEVIAGDAELWGQLSNSLAIFLSPDQVEEYVLPNQFESHTVVGDYFDVGPLVRAVVSGQSAFALTLSASGWSLWQATPSSRIEKLAIRGSYATDAADASNLTDIRGRTDVDGMSGDERRKIYLERYAQVVGDAVRAELRLVDKSAQLPLFVFATEPLLGLLRSQDLPWQIEAVPGAPDELRPVDLDQAIRARLSELHAARLNALAETIGGGFTAGLAATDLSHIGRAVAIGAVDTLIYSFGSPVLGTIDPGTGEISYTDQGYDLLPRIAVLVLRTGGQVWAVRPEEITTEIWNGQVLARLRHSLAG